MGETQIPNDLIILLLGTGGATFLWTVAKVYLAIRDNAESREDKAVRRLSDWEADCRQQLAREREMGAYWFRVTGIYSHALLSHGVEEPMLPPRPASMPDAGPYDHPRLDETDG